MISKNKVVFFLLYIVLFISHVLPLIIHGLSALIPEGGTGSFSHEGAPLKEAPAIDTIIQHSPLFCLVIKIPILNLVL